MATASPTPCSHLRSSDSGEHVFSTPSSSQGIHAQVEMTLGRSVQASMN